MLGYEAEECLHHPYYHWIYPEDVNKDKDRMEKLKSGKTASLQLEKRRYINKAISGGYLVC